MKTSFSSFALLTAGLAALAVLSRLASLPSVTHAGLETIAGSFVTAGVLLIAFSDYSRATPLSAGGRPQRSFLARLVRREDRRLAA